MSEFARDSSGRSATDDAGTSLQLNCSDTSHREAEPETGLVRYGASVPRFSRITEPSLRSQCWTGMYCSEALRFVNRRKRSLILGTYHGSSRTATHNAPRECKARVASEDEGQVSATAAVRTVMPAYRTLQPSTGYVLGWNGFDRFARLCARTHPDSEFILGGKLVRQSTLNHWVMPTWK
jgi:hypothetical protein